MDQPCESTFSERYWPAEYRAIDNLPLTANGKVDYRALVKMAKEIAI